MIPNGREVEPGLLRALALRTSSESLEHLRRLVMLSTHRNSVLTQ
jgi:hypothetical protein